MRPVQHRRSASSSVYVLLGVLFVGLTLAAVGGVVYVASQRDPASPTTAKAEGASRPAEAPPPRPVKVEKKERPLAVDIIPAKPPEPPKPPTFDEAYAAAVKLGQQLDEAEPQQTEGRLRLLTFDEKFEFNRVTRAPAPKMHPNAVEVLRRLGMAQKLDRMARAVTAADPSFKSVATVLWNPASGAEGVVAMMNVWGAIPPLELELVRRAVERNQPTAGMLPETRNFILALGGERWLAR